MKITPRILKGFRDAQPEQEILRRETVHQLERAFRSHGLVPIDTPVLEYKEVLLGKGGGETDKQVYEFTDNGGREVAMRFDLTVPFARFMAMYSRQLPMPFKRYHIAKVWRGENTQKGRYREFYQCDFDIVGVDTAAADFEILLIILDSLTSIGVKDFTIHISHRGIFNDFLKTLSLEDSLVEVLRAVDKLAKIGEDKTKALLETIVTADQAAQILSYITFRSSDRAEVLQHLSKFVSADSPSVASLSAILDYLNDFGTGLNVVTDLSITRGLDYYTGIVYETFLDNLPSIGSICSGGRYNNLASLYTKEKLPGVGASIGLDRLLAAFDDPALADSLTVGRELRSSDLLIICMDENLTGFYGSIASQTRAKGIKTELYPLKRKLPQQFKYGERFSIPYALIIGSAEREKGVVNLKNLTTFNEYKEISLSQAIEKILQGA